MNKNNKKIGIWGFGVTGKSAASFFKRHGCTNLQIMDKKMLSADEQNWLQSNNITFINQNQSLDNFFNDNDLLFVTPGIDLKPYPQIAHKLISELDIFYNAWPQTQPIIAITGSIGKTTVTTLLAAVLAKSGLRVLLGGNIGVGMLDLTEQAELCDTVVLELSSFQLSQAQHFAPTLAIWTNLYPNHLDWHASLDEYAQAKSHIYTQQQPPQLALLPFALKDLPPQPAIAHYFSITKPSDARMAQLPRNSTLFYSDNNTLIAHTNGISVPLYACADLPDITFAENWLVIVAALYLQRIPIPNLAHTSFALPEHRLEKVATINGVDFINDSKSTTPQSTLAAVQALSKRPVLLLLGGLSKGIDRKPLIETLKGQVKKIYCFGKEAEQLAQFCRVEQIPYEICANLDQTMQLCKEQAHTGDQVLLSPAGSSFDLFTNYIERGNYFKKLVGNQ